MVPCLMTLTDLQTRRAGLSASAARFLLHFVDSNMRMSQKAWFVLDRRKTWKWL